VYRLAERFRFLHQIQIVVAKAFKRFLGKQLVVSGWNRANREMSCLVRCCGLEEFRPVAIAVRNEYRLYACDRIQFVIGDDSFQLGEA
jgi:hypothetical protein